MLFILPFFFNKLNSHTFIYSSFVRPTCGLMHYVSIIRIRAWKIVCYISNYCKKKLIFVITLWHCWNFFMDMWRRERYCGIWCIENGSFAVHGEPKSPNFFSQKKNNWFQHFFTFVISLTSPWIPMTFHCTLKELKMWP